MEKLIKVKATLVRASKNDVFTQDEIPRENKILFIRDMLTGKFTSTHVINSTSMYATYYLAVALYEKFLYRLSETHDEGGFTFELILRPADDYDLFWNPRMLKDDVVYYSKNTPDTITGPLILSSSSDMEAINKGLADGILYVPNRQQTFEIYKILKSA
ncbi:hypothetical protein ACI6PS_02375 [Flavobacterium sp. PLA-1-15]|uniref:hypothetical protein n=1 Tax=Flavobacterium sp. PLA-1-15 TaxID=3380533 RepID=UPI003B780956